MDVKICCVVLLLLPISLFTFRFSRLAAAAASGVNDAENLEC